MIEVICCEGPPACSFSGDEAVQAQLDGCPRCKRIVIRADGSEIEYRKIAQS